MKEIIGLTIKDCMTLKSYMKTIIFMIILFSVCMYINGDITSFMPVYIPLFFGILAMSSFSYDNLSKSDKYLLTFPVSKKDVVKARYLYVLLLTFVGSVLGLLLTIFIALINNKVNFDLESVLSTLLGAVCGISIFQIFQILQIPIMYKFGAEKGRMIQIILVVALMVIISVAITMVNGFSLNMFEKYGVIIGFVAIVLLYVLSYKISCKIYEKKEF